MVVCQFFLLGQCKYGDACRNEHTNKHQTTYQIWETNNTWAAPKALLSSPPTIPLWNFTPQTLKDDFTPLKAKPLWPLSSYGPERWQETILRGLDVSPEELRLVSVNASRRGGTAVYRQYERDKIASADKTYLNALANVDQLFRQASLSREARKVSVPLVSLSGFGARNGGGFTPGRFWAIPEPWSSSVPTTESAISDTTATFEQLLQSHSALGQPQRTVSSTFSQQNVTRSTCGQQQRPTSAFGQSQSRKTHAASGNKPTFSQPQGTIKGLIAPKLFCLVQGDKPASNRLFQVEVSPEQTVLDLRDEIWKKRKPKLLAQNPLLAEIDFVLHTPDPPILLRDEEAFERKIAELDAEGKSGALLKKLNLWSTLEEAGLSNPNSKQLHIFVVIC